MASQHPSYIRTQQYARLIPYGQSSTSDPDRAAQQAVDSAYDSFVEIERNNIIKRVIDKLNLKTIRIKG